MRIEYEDQEILVIYKEAGLPVQTGRTSQKDVVSLLKNHLAKQAASEREKQDPDAAAGKEESRKGADRLPSEPYLGIIHRLDQPVEGLLVFAKTPKSAAALSAQAASKTGMEKEYQAVVCLNESSYPQAIAGMKKDVTLTDWLGRDTATNTAYVTSEEEKGAKRAELEFRTLWIREGRALLRIRLHTGRHHQIRVQMAHAGMPLLGDRKYGNNESADPAAGMTFSAGGKYEDKEGKEADSGSDRRACPLCLCAWRLAFQHPATGKKMQFCVEPAFSEAFLLE